MAGSGGAGACADAPSRPAGKPGATLVRNALTYSGSTLLSQALSLVENLVVRRILPPVAMGLWEFAQVIQNVANTFDPGINAAARFELPQLDGAGAHAQESRVRSTVLLANLGLSLLATGGVLVYAFGVLGSSADRFPAAVAASLLMVPAALAGGLSVVLQGRQHFVPLSRAAFGYALLSALLLPAGAYWRGATGLLGAAVAVAALQPLLLWAAGRAGGLRLGLGWDVATVRRLLGFGLPLRLADSPQGLFTALDTLVVSSLLGLGPLALYAIVKSAVLQAVALVGPAWSVFMMRTFHLTGARTERAVLAEQVRTALLIQNLLLNPLLICLMVPAFEFLVARVLPAYATSAPLVRILPFSIYFLPQTTQIRNFWMLDKRLVPLGVSNLVGLATLGGGIFLTTRLQGVDLPAIATGTVLGYLGYYLFIVLSVGRELWGTAGAVHMILHTLLGLAVSKLVIETASSPIGSGDLASQLVALASACVLSVLALAPLLLYGAWRTRLLHHVRRDLGWAAG